MSHLPDEVQETSKDAIANLQSAESLKQFNLSDAEFRSGKHLIRCLQPLLGESGLHAIKSSSPSAL
jgi:hypothetical protein